MLKVVLLNSVSMLLCWLYSCGWYHMALLEYSGSTFDNVMMWGSSMCLFSFVFIYSILSFGDSLRTSLNISKVEWLCIYLVSTLMFAMGFTLSVSGGSWMVFSWICKGYVIKWSVWGAVMLASTTLTLLLSAFIWVVKDRCPDPEFKVSLSTNLYSPAYLLGFINCFLGVVLYMPLLLTPTTVACLSYGGWLSWFSGMALMLKTTVLCCISLTLSLISYSEATMKFKKIWPEEWRFVVSEISWEGFSWSFVVMFCVTCFCTILCLLMFGAR